MMYTMQSKNSLCNYNENVESRPTNLVQDTRHIPHYNNTMTLENHCFVHAAKFPLEKSCYWSSVCVPNLSRPSPRSRTTLLVSQTLCSYLESMAEAFSVT